MKSHKKHAKMPEVQHTKKVKRKRKVSSSSVLQDDSCGAGEPMDPHKSKKLKTRQVSFKDKSVVPADATDVKKCSKSEKDAKGVRKLQLQEANKEEDKIINRLEKVLGMNKRRKKEKKSTKKIPSAFADDGLDYILEVLDKSNNVGKEDLDLNEDLPPQMGNKNSKSYKKKETKSLSESEEDEMMNDGNSGGSDSSAEESEMSNNNNSDVDDESDDDSQNDLELQSAGSVKSDDLEPCESEDSEVGKKPKNKKQKPKIWEDIYGRLRDEKGNILPNSSQAGQVYVPPHERMKKEAVSDERKTTLERIKKQLKGLINRLSESNMNPISSEIEGMYMKNSRNDMNETLVSILYDVLASPVSVPPRFALEQAMLIALLHGNIGSEIGAFFLQNLALKFDELLNTGRNCEQGKECHNILTFLCHLCSFKVAHSLLIFDILKLLVESFQETDIELILLVLKHSGFTLRKDDPLAFKEVLLAAQTKASSLKPEQNQSRVNFMLDILIEVRNNNMEKMKKLLNYDPSISEHLKKVLRGLVRKGSYIQELSISYEDLLKAHERGRWWIVGSAWSERTPENNTAEVKNDSIPVEDNSVSDKILHLAKKLHINTETRKVVFGIIMTSQDYMCAFESLLRLKLKNQQEKEIISVLLYCCLQEKTFNPYYAYLTSQFCKFDRRFRGYLKFSLWDKLKELESMKASQRNCLASLLVHLFTTESLDISILKVIHFSEMNKTMVQFFRKILTAILLHEKEEMCSKVFQRVASNKNLNLLRESLRLFMHHFILRRKSQVDPLVAEKLTQRVKMAEDSLNSAKHAFKL